LAYSTQPARSRVRIEYEAGGGLTITLLPLSFRRALLLDMSIGACVSAMLLAFILHECYSPRLAPLLRGPAVVAQWALAWAELTAFHAVFGLVVTLWLVGKTTTVRITGGTLRVQCRRWYWRTRHEWPLDRLRGVRVTWAEVLALLDADGKVLCKLDVPERADLRWLFVVMQDLLATDWAGRAPVARITRRTIGLVLADP
jgi:hypothetical protein